MNVPEVDPSLLAQARAATELAQHALDPRTFPEPEVAAPSALVLLGQAVHVLLALRQGRLEPTLVEQWAAADHERLAVLAGGQEELETLRSLILTNPAASTGHHGSLMLAAQAVSLFVDRLLAEVDAPRDALARVRFQRLARILLVAGMLVLCALLSFRAVTAMGRGPDLARGKPWKASSAADDCPLGVAGICMGEKVEIFFHTKSEENPWLKIDLERQQQVSQVLIVNRGDCCQGRAMPLVVESSIDGQDWQLVQRREKRFSEWLLAFPPRNVRHLRISVPGKTALHLERISVYR